MAAAIESLADEQKLDLDDPMGNWIPNLDPIYADITVRMLLKHTSGLYSYLPRWDDPDAHTLEEILETALSHDPSFAPGTGYEYSNTNYIALGLILEAVEDKTVGEILRQRALEPAGLVHTFFGPEEDIVGETATPFFHGTGLEMDPPPNLSALWTAGGMVSDAADAANWVWELYGARSVVDSASVDEMINDSVPCTGEVWPQYTEANYGHGTSIMLLEDGNCGCGVGHEGTWPGTTTDAFYFEDCRTSVAVLQNMRTFEVELVLNKVVQALFP